MSGLGNAVTVTRFPLDPDSGLNVNQDASNGDFDPDHATFDVTVTDELDPSTGKNILLVLNDKNGSATDDEPISKIDVKPFQADAR
jgi:hypothetical protein